MLSSILSKITPSFTPGLTASPKANPTSSGEGQEKIGQVMQKVLDAKRSRVETALANKWNRYNPILIGGDFFTFGYLAFQGMRTLKPSMQNLAAVGALTLVFGLVAGAINVGVGIVCLKEAIQAFKNGDKVLGLRMSFDCFCLTSIGVVMILASLAVKLSILAGIGSFFASNPWCLPVLFFLITIPLLTELTYRLKNLALGSSLGTQLKLNELASLLNEKNPDWEKIDALYESPDHPLGLKELKMNDPKELPKLLSAKMEMLQADIGVAAAVEVFDLLMQIQKRNQKEAKLKLELAKQKIQEWNRSLYVRIFQQILYFAGFCLSMASLSPKMNASLLNGTQSFFLVGANVIPFYMDAFWPFKRNTPIVVPKIEEKEISIQ